MQANGDGLNDEIETQERRKTHALHELMEANAELDRLRELARVHDMTPEQRREDVRRRTAAIAIVRRALAGAGILLALDWLRSSPRQAVAATAAYAVVTVGAIGALPEEPDLSIAPDGPSLVLAPTPTPTRTPDPHKSAVASPPIEGDEAPPPTNGSPLGTPGIPDASPAPAPTSAGPLPTSSPTGPSTPAPSGTPEPPPEPSPTPTRPPPDPPPPDPPSTPAPSPTPSPTVTITASPPPPPPAEPAIPEECLLFVDIPALLELCLLDLEQGGGGQLLDGAIGGRGVWG